VTLQDRAESEANHRRFVQRIKVSHRVWGLRSKEGGWASCPSNDHEGKTVICFWSDRAYAARHVKETWADYEPAPIELDTFINRWLAGMDQEGVLAGTNWDDKLCGLEIAPRTLAQELLTDEEKK